MRFQELEVENRLSMELSVELGKSLEETESRLADLAAYQAEVQRLRAQVESLQIENHLASELNAELEKTLEEALNGQHGDEEVEELKELRERLQVSHRSLFSPEFRLPSCIL